MSGSTGQIDAIKAWLATLATRTYVDSRFVSVLDFGAAGDGVTDDTAAIQAVLNTYAGKATVLIPLTSSTYRCTTLYLPWNTDLVLNGTLLALPTITNAVVLCDHAGRSSIRGTGIIDGNRENVPGNDKMALAGLAISVCADVRVEGIVLQNAYWWNLNVTQSNNVIIDDVSFVDGGAANEFAAQSSECWLTNCFFKNDNNADYAFCFYGGVQNSGAIGNTIQNAGVNMPATRMAPGIGVMSDVAQGAPCHNIIIANNIVHNCGGPGFVLLGYNESSISTGLVLANNRSFSNCKNGQGIIAGADVFVDFVQDVLITGNMISDNGNPAGPFYTGIFLGPHSKQLTVADNHIFNIGSGLGPATGGNNNAGIYAANPTDAFIANNHFYDSQPTPSMAFSIVGGVLARSAIVGNYFGVPFSCAYSPDTVVANYQGGIWYVETPARFNHGADVFDAINLLQGRILASEDWRNSGGHFGWNYAGNGMTNFINSRGLGPGGFSFYNVASGDGQTPALMATIDAAAILNLAGAGVSAYLGGAQAAVMGFDWKSNALQVYANGTLEGAVAVGVPAVNATNDADAAAAGVAVGGTYRNGSVLMVRVV